MSLESWSLSRSAMSGSSSVLVNCGNDRFDDPQSETTYENGIQRAKDWRQ
jgi:hypothetical protein